MSTPPPVSPPQIPHVTPRTAKRIARVPEAAPKPKRPRLLQADEELELPDDDLAAPNRDNSAILTDERYIPSNPEIIRLREIAADPSGHFLPTVKIGGSNMIYAGPEGLAPELAALFSFPTTILRRDRGVEDEGPAAKRPRMGATAEDEEMEAGRRGSMLPPSEGGLGGFGADDTFDMDVPDFPGEFDLGPMASPRRQKEASIAPPLRAESIARAIQIGEDKVVEYPLAMFDPRHRAATEASQSLNGTPTKSAISEDRRRTSSGYSRNTGMAMGFLRRELEAIEEEDRVVEFEKVAEKVSLPIFGGPVMFG